MPGGVHPEGDTPTALLASVTAVVEQVQDAYPVDVAIAVVKHFSSTVIIPKD